MKPRVATALTFFVRNRIFLAAKRPLFVTGSSNWIPAGGTFLEGSAEGTSGADPGFVDGQKRDFRLRSGSPCVHRGTGDLEYVNGDGVKHRLTVDRCYLPPLSLAQRSVAGLPDLGAYELGATFKEGMRSLSRAAP